MAHGTRTARASADDAYDVVVVGGGIAGLTAAYALRDRDVLLLEADDRDRRKDLAPSPVVMSGSTSARTSSAGPELRIRTSASRSSVSRRLRFPAGSPRSA